MHTHAHTHTKKTGKQYRYSSAETNDVNALKMADIFEVAEVQTDAEHEHQPRGYDPGDGRTHARQRRNYVLTGGRTDRKSIHTVGADARTHARSGLTFR